MKQLFTIAILLGALSASAQSKLGPGIIIDSNKVAQVDSTKYMPRDTTGQLYVLAPVQVWQQLLNALDKSTDSHLLIVELSFFISEQLKSQGRKRK